MFSQLCLSLLDRRDAENVTSGDFNSIQEFRLKVENITAGITMVSWIEEVYKNVFSASGRLISHFELQFS